MSIYRDAADGLVTVLQAGITNLKAYNHPVDNVNHFPCAIILPEPIDPQICFGGNTFQGAFRVVFLVASADSWEGFAQLYDHLDPTEANKSLIKAVRADRTLNGKVDSSDVDRIENIGRRELWGGFYFGYDAIISFIRSVA